MARRKHGEFIKIDWDSINPLYDLVRGWVTEDEAREACRYYYGHDCDEWSCKIEHGYDHWNVFGNWSNYDQCNEPGRGRFKVTYVKWQKAQEAG